MLLLIRILANSILRFPMPRSVYFSVPVPATGGRDNHEAYTSNDGSATTWHSVEGSTSNALSFGWPGPGQPYEFVRPV